MLEIVSLGKAGHKLFRGEYVIEVVDAKSGLVKDVRRGENLWLDQGSRLCVNRETSVYLSICNTTSEPSYTDTVIPSVRLATVGVSKTYQTGSNYKRHLFSAYFSPPSSDRTINAVGLSRDSNGNNAYCWTKLTAPIVQTPQDSLYVYYYVYVNPPLSDGFGVNGYDNFAQYGVFYYIGDYLYVRNGLRSDVKPDETWSSNSARYSLGYLGYNSGKYKRWWYGNIGSSSDLGSFVGLWPSFDFVINGSCVCRNVGFGRHFLGRVWAKNKASSAMFFDSSNLPTGWGRAVEVRPVGGGEYNSGLDWNGAGVLVVWINQSGAVGQATYRISYWNADGWFGTPYIINSTYDTASGELFNVCGRDWFVTNYNNVTRLINKETHGYVNISGSRELYCGQVGNVLITRRRNAQTEDYNENRYFDRVVKYEFTDANDIRKFTRTELPLGVSSEIGFMVGNDKFYFLSGNKFQILDINTGNITNTWIDGTNIFLTGSNSWGCYDEEKDWIIFVDQNVGGWRVFHRLGNDVNNFTGITDFSTTIVKDWWDADRGDASGRFWQLGNGLLNITTSTGNISGTTWTPCALLQKVQNGVFEVTMCIDNFNPTVNYQEIGLVVRNYGTSFSAHKRIGLRYNGGKKVEVVSNAGGGSNTVEGSISFAGNYVRFKITRDGSNVIRCYYSTDPITTPDNLATWTLVGNQTYTLAGDVLVGIEAHTAGGTTTATGQIREFRINNGNIDKRRVYIRPIEDAVTSYWYNQEDGKFGLIGVGNHGYYFRSFNKFTQIDKNDFSVLSQSSLTPVGGSNWMGVSVRRADNGDDIIVGYNFNYVHNSSALAKIHMGINNVQYLQEYNWTVGYTRQWFYISKNGKNRFGDGYACVHERDYSWDGSKWVISGGAGNKPTHSDWQPLPLGNLEIRFLNNPTNPGATFSSNDKYEVWFSKNQPIKDNQQYVTNVGVALYYCDVREANETYTNVPSTWTLNAKQNNAGLWLTTDFDWKWSFYFKQGGDYAYWSDVTSAFAVSEVTSNSEFKTNDANAHWVYNYYKNMYVEFVTGANAGIRRKIVEYDGYYKKFVVESAFPNAIQVGDTFKVRVPAQASKVGTLTAPNQFVVNESAGTISVHANDVGKDVELKYLYLLRSW
jgi:hypothetical protein